MNAATKTKKVSHTAEQVANFFLALSNETGEVVTNLKLQKLVYYAQAWHLANYGEPLFEEEFEAWVHGPVIPALYHAYKERGSMPIVTELRLKDIESEVGNKTFGFLMEVAKVYMPYGAFELEMMTHKEDPWIEARKDCNPEDKCSNVVKKVSMQRYYGEKTKNKTN